MCGSNSFVMFATVIFLIGLNYFPAVFVHLRALIRDTGFRTPMFFYHFSNPNL